MSLIGSALAAAVAVGVVGVFAQFAYAEESGTSTVTVTPEKLEKDVKKFIGQNVKQRNERATAQRIAMVERRIAELKKHVEHYELLLERLKAPTGSVSSSTKQNVKQRLIDYASSTKAKRPIEMRGEVRGISDVKSTGGLVLKVNGSTGPVFLQSRAAATISWNTGKAKECLLQLMSAHQSNVVFAAMPVRAGRGSLSVAVPTMGTYPAQLRLLCGKETARTSVVVPLNYTPSEEGDDGDNTPDERGSLEFKVGAGNPDAMSIVVSKDLETDTALLEYTITAKGDDVQFDQLAVKLTSSAPLAKVIEVDDVFLEIDGQIFDPENLPTSSTRSFVFNYDIDGDVEIEAGKSITVRVLANINPQGEDAVYPHNTTIKAEVGNAERNLTVAESANVLAAADMAGVAVGNTHRLVSAGAVLNAGSFESSFEVSGQNNTLGEFTLSYEISAVGGDVYVPKSAVRGRTDATAGVNYRVEGATSSMRVTGILLSTADEEGNYFKVDEGSTETFELTVTVDPTTSGSYRVQLIQFNWNAAPSNSGMKTQLLLPPSEYRSEFGAIMAN